MLQIWALINTIILAPIMVFQIVSGALIFLFGSLFKRRRLKVHGKDLAIAADQNMNTVWLGYPDETISSRTGRAILSGKPKWYIKYLLRPFIDRTARVFGDKPNHCVRAVESALHMDIQYEIWKWYKD